jgi:CAAX protease family protein
MTEPVGASGADSLEVGSLDSPRSEVSAEPGGQLADARLSEAPSLTQPGEPERLEQLELFAIASEDRSGLAVELAEQPFLYSSDPPPLPPPPARHPNLADVLILLMMFFLGLLATSFTIKIAVHFHLFGLKSIDQAKDDTHVALVTLLMIYLTGLAMSIPALQSVWNTGFFTGVHWHAPTAWRLRNRLVGVAFLGNILAMIGNQFLPFPKEAPIDKMFDSPLDAWMLFIFGVTVAPFFEEMIFRGFLLPALATAWDWCRERMTGTIPKQPDLAGNPIWSLPAMIFAALVASVPFAWMHAAQDGYAWGPLILLYCVSLILCTVRLVTKSLAASTLVHSAYNFMLFSLMLVQTSGFRHLDKG